MKNQYRQGDVFIEQIIKTPKTAQPVAREGGDVILAHGEVTGHAHRIRDPGVCMLQAGEGERYLTIAGEHFVRLTHEEHAPIVLPPGNYRVTIQREYDWAEQASRAVAD